MRGANGVVGILRTSVLARILLTRHSCSKLFVAGLSWDTNEPVLKEAFGKHGEIIEGSVKLFEAGNNFVVKVICDHVSGKSRGYGFVKFTSESEATIALKEMDVKVICDHVSGKSRGYGFVKFTSESEATIALKEMDGQVLDGRQIRLQFAHKE
ncbi:hypothetical protein C1H46_037077 [Malus baccata]|uniref:RRM domain-containing protein n=1 Tax=Malus baccata TaxID=106549 RepID=A0A540KT76_MALBA|nr:hypothetical protein C1H46_037077 [Malus baccata]